MSQVLSLAGHLHTIASSAVQCFQNTTCQTGLPTPGASAGNLQNILQIIFGVLALVAILVIIIWGGLRFVTAQGDPQEVAKARNTIIYAGIGLGVAVSGEIIVSFVLNRL
jgi:hypothetical protein